MFAIKLIVLGSKPLYGKRVSSKKAHSCAEFAKQENTQSQGFSISFFYIIIHVYCPGVDDNGSGMAALLETARQIGTANMNGVIRNNTIIFVAFDLEEYGTKMHEN